MDAKDIRKLYAYNSWANARTLASAAVLGPEEFTRHNASSHPSVRDTLVHAMAAELIWLRRWQGDSPKSLLDPSQFPTHESVAARWSEVERDLSAFASGVTDEALARVVAYTNTRGEKWRYPLVHLMQHVVNHSTYHRGQVTTMLRQLGATPAPTDFLLYLDAQ